MNSGPELQYDLGTVSHPDPFRARAAFFGNEARAVEHLVNHVLTAPESQAWALVFEDAGDDRLAQVVNDSQQCYRVAKQAHESGAAAVSGLMDAYRQAVDRACFEASRLHWWATDGHVTVSLGIRAVFAVIEKCTVKTAYIPAQGTPEAVLRRQERKGVPVPFMPARKMRNHRETRKDSRAVEREKEWTLQQKIYYRLFRPAVQFIRSRYHGMTAMNGARRNDLALLKDRLPSMSNLKYEKWLEYYRQVQVKP